ncbi:uncharacterized protein PHACADRAFT_198855 [Phanerochaete carnosa HHB-10118-sp]|uniref:Uncharacterized protein n=1 Tax=Phanerochaete carnosa (strain HHB-10118-sp) TaxID=650164 RepID=K5W160_PHACS|nr:uncharacterized protein PHACADRAFT_198855 [Phanerochaete carnosa HHB-10118-sp]EKM52810.1 hypothetical protein PHACADRAFT_198855 [Phanerochaete carnosa HHB-10118-sp]
MLERSNYRAFEAALFDLDDVPEVKIKFRRGSRGFKPLLNDVLSGAALNRLFRTNKLDLVYEAHGVTMRYILFLFPEHTADGSTIKLSPSEWFDYLLLETVGEKNEFLGNIGLEVILVFVLREYSIKLNIASNTKARWIEQLSG